MNLLNKLKLLKPEMTLEQANALSLSKEELVRKEGNTELATLYKAIEKQAQNMSSLDRFIHVDSISKFAIEILRSKGFKVTSNEDPRDQHSDGWIVSWEPTPKQAPYRNPTPEQVKAYYDK